MRLLFSPLKIPVLAMRPWRLLRELDEFDDAECRAVFDDLHRARVIGLSAAFPIALVLGVSIQLGGQLVLENALGPRNAWLDAETFQGRVSHLVRGGFMLAIALTAAFVPYAVIMRAAIRRRLTNVSCRGCDYPLIGLVVEDGAVICPECGGTTVLAEHGLREADIAAGAMKRTRAAPVAPSRRRLWTAAAVGLVSILIAVWAVTGQGGLLRRGLPYLVGAFGIAWYCRMAVAQVGSEGSSGADSAEAPLDPPQR